MHLAPPSGPLLFSSSSHAINTDVADAGILARCWSTFLLLLLFLPAVHSLVCVDATVLSVVCLPQSVAAHPRTGAPWTQKSSFFPPSAPSLEVPKVVSVQP